MRSLFSLIVMLLSVSLHSQITVSSESLPDIGDVLEFTIFSNFEDTLEYRKSGPNTEWDLTSFNAVTGQQETYLDITGTELADSFPDANMIVEFGGFQAAAERTDSTVSIVGLLVDGFGGFDVNADVFLEDPFRLRYTPFEYEDVIEDDFQVQISISADIIPFLDSLDVGIPGATIDSVRVTLDIAKREEAIGWGTLTIAGQQQEVLQILENNSTETTIEIGVNLGIFFWIDATDLLDGLGGDGVPNIGGNQSITTYKFMNMDDKRAIIQFDESMVLDTAGTSSLVVNGRTSAEFLTDVEDIILNPTITISPNPADQHIDVKGTEQYNILDSHIYNINGQIVMSNVKIPGDDRIDIQALSTGTYMLLIRTEEGLITEKFMVK
jgi:hypothetical protein